MLEERYTIVKAYQQERRDAAAAWRLARQGTRTRRGWAQSMGSRLAVLFHTDGVGRPQARPRTRHSAAGHPAR